MQCTTIRAALLSVGVSVGMALSQAAPAAAADVFDIFLFDPTAPGPWSDVDDTTITARAVEEGTIDLDGEVSSEEYGGFEGIAVTPGDNAWILDFPGDRSWDGEEDSSFTFYLAHDREHVYVGVSVADETVVSDNEPTQFWKDDAVEIMIHPFNDRSGASAEGVNPWGGHAYFNYLGAFSEWPNSRQRWSSAVPWLFEETGEVWAVGGETDEGWVLEIRFHKSLFEDPGAGNVLDDGYVMGFNIGLDDDDGRGPTSDGFRSNDLELQYWWANRARSSDGRLTFGATGEVILEPLEGGDPETRFRRGDANADGNQDLSDAVSILGYLFLGGPSPSCTKSADSDDTGNIDLTDAIYLLGHLFLGGPEPGPPFEECGNDPTEDGLDCVAYAPCGEV